LALTVRVGVPDLQAKLAQKEYMRGDPKITGVIFLKWSIRFYTITTLVSFKVLSF